MPSVKRERRAAFQNSANNKTFLPLAYQTVSWNILCAAGKSGASTQRIVVPAAPDVGILQATQPRPRQTQNLPTYAPKTVPDEPLLVRPPAALPVPPPDFAGRVGYKMLGRRLRHREAAQRAMQYITPSVRRVDSENFFSLNTHVHRTTVPPSVPEGKEQAQEEDFSYAIPAIEVSSHAVRDAKPLCKKGFVLKGLDISHEEEAPSCTAEVKTSAKRRMVSDLLAMVARTESDENSLMEIVASAVEGMDVNSVSNIMETLKEVVAPDKSATPPPPPPDADALDTIKLPDKNSVVEWQFMRNMMEENNEAIPEEFLDPITMCPLYTPVIIAGGECICDRLTVTEAEDMLVAGDQPDDFHKYPELWVNRQVGKKLLALVKASWLVSGCCDTSNVDEKRGLQVQRWLEPKRLRLHGMMKAFYKKRTERLWIAGEMTSILMSIVEVVTDDRQRSVIVAEIKGAKKYHFVAEVISTLEVLQGHLSRTAAIIQGVEDEQVVLANRYSTLKIREELERQQGGESKATHIMAPLKSRWRALSATAKHYREVFREHTITMREAKSELSELWNDGEGVLWHGPPGALVVLLPKPTQEQVTEALNLQTEKIRAAAQQIPWKKKKIGVLSRKQGGALAAVGNMKDFKPKKSRGF